MPKCEICNIELADTDKYVCPSHVVDNRFKFILGEVYPKLKDKTDALVRMNKKLILRHLFFEMYGGFAHAGNELLYDPSKYTTDEYRQKYSGFYETGRLIGYGVWRMAALFPDLGERIEKMLSAQQSEKYRQAELIILEEFYNNLSLEMDVLLFAMFWLKNYFSIATDDLKNPKKIVIIPKADIRAVKHCLQLRLIDANEQWRESFEHLPAMHGSIKAWDYYGRYVHYHHDRIRECFSSFKDVWRMEYGNSFPGSFDDYVKLKEWLRWMVSPIGYNFGHHEKANFFDDYASIGLSEPQVISILDQVLKEPGMQLLTNQLQKSIMEGRFEHQAIQIATGFSIKGKHESIWFTPVLHWFSNKLNNVHLRFAISNRLAGDSYEDDVRIFCECFARGFKVSTTDSLFGVIIRPELQPKQSDPEVLPKLLARQLKFSIQLGGERHDGEIDFVVFSNNSLYLIEAKSVDMESRNSTSYLESKAAAQCSKYCQWIRNSNEWLALLKSQGISPDLVSSIRVLILSNGVYENLTVESPDGERFGVIPEHVLFSTLVGIIPALRKGFFPTRYMECASAFGKVFPDLVHFLVPEANPAFEDVARRAAEEWLASVLFDRRKPFTDFKQSAAPPFFPPIQMIERYIGGAISWKLPKPLLLASTRGWEYYVGTQISAVGATYSCDNCKLSVKYYIGPESESMTEAGLLCPKCSRRLLKEYDNEILLNMHDAVLSYRIQKDKERYPGMFEPK